MKKAVMIRYCFFQFIDYLAVNSDLGVFHTADTKISQPCGD